MALSPLLHANEPVEMVFAGDAMQHGPQLRNARQSDNTYSYRHCFDYVKDYISSADFSAVNLEAPLAGEPYKGYPQFSAPDSYAQALFDLGFDLLQTTNNHCLDRGAKGAMRTFNTLNRLRIPQVGLYPDIATADSLSPYISDIRGIKMAFLAYTYGTEFGKGNSPIVVNYIDREKIRRDIARAKSLNVDGICVMMHWGEEYHMLPDETQRSLADFIFKEGADIIIGTHPHVIEPCEIRTDPTTGKRKLLVYSLGNFISNQNDLTSRGGAMVRLHITKDLDNGGITIKDASYSLVFVQKPNTGAANCFQLIPAGRDSLVSKQNLPTYKSFLEKSRKILNQYNIDVPEEEIK